MDPKDVYAKGRCMHECSKASFFAYFTVFLVQLVEVSPITTLVDVNRVSKKSATDLVELAMEIQKADTFIHANACNKLQVIAQQASERNALLQTLFR